MLPTYPAVLRTGRLEWGTGGPVLPPDDPIPVHVTLLAAPAPDRGPAMAAALAALAALADAGGPSGFGDPVEWQRESRADRPLPGRGE